MSGGQYRLLDIGRALVLDPEIIPFRRVDRDDRTREIYTFIRTLPEHGISVVLVIRMYRNAQGSQTTSM